jgi:thiamine-monophosphate kinase
MLIKGQVSAPENTALPLLRAHHLPVPCLEAGKTIAKSGLAGAMIDLSDGLASDLRHVCEASGVGARIFRSALPLSREIRELTEINSLDPFDLALYGGEDYRLLVTVPSERRPEFEALFEHEEPCTIFKVGEITANKGIRMVMADGQEDALTIGGYDHFHRNRGTIG